MMIPKNKRQRSNKITQSAKGEQCTLRIPDVCNFDTETTVFAHANGAGMGTKAHDAHGCYACSSCHDWLDNKTHTYVPRQEKQAEFGRAMMETQSILFEKGLIRI